MSSLSTKIEGNKVFLKGFLDEHADLQPIGGLKGDVVINFKEVQRVNSCGVRDWVNAISGAKAGVSSLSYEECPIVVVKQLNAVPDFRAGANVLSIAAPYFCEECDEEAEVMIDLKSFSGTPPAPKCPNCGADGMNFDAIASNYFSFIKR